MFRRSAGRMGRIVDIFGWELGAGLAGWFGGLGSDVRRGGAGGSRNLSVSFFVKRDDI